MDEFLAKARRRKVRKGSYGNLSSLALTETMINPETGDLRTSAAQQSLAVLIVLG